MWNPFKRNKKEKQEVRQIPSYVRMGDDVSTDWIVTRVFCPDGGNDRQKRVYYAGIYNASTKKWDIEEIQYSSERRGAWKSAAGTYSSAPSATEALIAIASIDKYLETKLVKDGVRYIPVAGLNDNLREVANLCGGYFDNSGRFVRLRDGQVATGNTVLRRDEIEKIFKDSEPEPPMFQGWDDYYKNIINPLAERILQNQDRLQEQTAILVGRIASVMDVTVPLQQRRETLADIGAHWGDKTQPEYNVYILSMLMQLGGQIYKQFADSTSISEETVTLLKDVGKAIEGFSRRMLGLTNEQAVQLSSVITHGPDPYMTHADEKKEDATPAPAVKRTPKPRKGYSP